MSTWNSLGSGAWSNAANWLGGVPDANGATADLSNLAGASITHTIDLGTGTFKVGRLDMTSSPSETYVLTHGRLTLQQTNVNNAAQINVSAEGLGLLAASILNADLTVQMNSSANINTIGSTTVLDADAFVTGVGALNKFGSGTLILSNGNNNYAGGTNIAAGRVSFSAAAFGSGDIHFTGSGTLRGTADVTLNNAILVDENMVGRFEADTGTTTTLTGTFSAFSGTDLHFGSAINGGTIDFAASNLGAIGADTISVDGGIVKASDSFDMLTSNAVTTNVAFGATLDANGVFLSVGHLTGSGTITNNGNSYVVINAFEEGDGTFSGVLKDGAAVLSLNKIGAGTMTLSGANTYSGTTEVAIGELKAGADNTLSANSVVVVDAGATLNIGGYDQTIEGLLGEGLVRADTASKATLTVAFDDTDYTFAGVLSDGNPLFGDLALVKSGNGTQWLSGQNTYTGTTTIAEGRLGLSGQGTIESSLDVSVNALATLDISGLTTSGTKIQNLISKGDVNLGGKSLILSHQSTNLTGNFIGGANADVLAVLMDPAVANISLASATFSSWTDGSDQVNVVGNALANAIVGSSRLDIMSGGDGNDTYVVNNAGDLVFEVDGGGTSDRVKTLGNYVLSAGAQVELFTTTNTAGTGAINLVGNSFDQLIQGNAGNNLINGGGGKDVMQGFGGDDKYFVDSADDVVLEAVGGGSDRVSTSISYALAGNAEIELFTTNNAAVAAAINLSGNSSAQTIQGNAGANIIDGLGGADTMQGFGGTDTYYVDNIGDKVVEAVGGGADTVLTSGNYTLGAGAEVEMFATSNSAGVDALNLIGNEFAQTIQGNAGANIINGMAGADTMQGFGGDDRYIVDIVGDQVVEAAGGGSDRVQTSVSYTLTPGSEIELFTTTNVALSTTINLTGNSFGQTIEGNAGANIINGGLGNDVLRGFGGQDSFLFDTAIGNANVDRILDFAVVDDSVRLENAVFSQITGVGVLTAQQFAANTTGAATDAFDRIIYETDTGKLFYDADGLGGDAAIQFALLTPNLAMTNADFFIV